VTRHWILLALLAVLAPLAWAHPAGGTDRLAPPVEQVLSELSLTQAMRDQVRQTLLRQRQERQQAEQSLRERHRAELTALLTPDQLVAMDEARPPLGADGRGPRHNPAEGIVRTAKIRSSARAVSVRIAVLASVALATSAANAQNAFVHRESLHVHPL